MKLLEILFRLIISSILIYILTELANLLQINLMHVQIENFFGGNEERKALKNSFVLSNILSNFLVWMLGGETFYQSLVTCYLPLVTSYQLLFISGKLLVTSHQLLVTSHLILSYQSKVTSYQSLVTSCQLLVTSYQ